MSSLISHSHELDLFKAVLTLGLALWSIIVVINNVVGFASAAAAIARTMSMAPLEAEPRVDSPLYGRKLVRPLWSRIALIAILACQIAAAVGLGVGGAGFVMAWFGHGQATTATASATLGLAAHAAAIILMMSGGLWFGYWIRQEGLQLTHVALLGMTAAAVLVINA